VTVERTIETLGDDVAEDYKFFVYHGLVHFIQLDRDRFEGTGRTDLEDLGRFDRKSKLETRQPDLGF
jgi:hypothetical protein